MTTEYLREINEETRCYSDERTEKKCLYNIERGTKAGREKKYANHIKNEVDTWQLGNGVAIYLRKKERKEQERKKNKLVQSLLCTVYSGVLRKKICRGLPDCQV